MKYSEECALRIEYYKASENKLAKVNQHRYEKELQWIRDGKMEDFEVSEEDIKILKTWLIK